MATGIKQQSKNPIKSQEFLADPGSPLSLSLSLFSFPFSIPRSRAGRALRALRLPIVAKLRLTSGDEDNRRSRAQRGRCFREIH